MTSDQKIILECGYLRKMKHLAQKREICKKEFDLKGLEECELLISGCENTYRENLSLVM